MSLEQLPVFVYGTLRPGEKNYRRYLAGRTISEVAATASGQLYFVADGGYPYVIQGEGSVVGKLVYLVPDRYEQTLQDLDALEEYVPGDEKNSVYLRRRALVRLPDGNERVAWIYYWNFPQITGTRITSGDFRDRPPENT